MSVEIFGMCKGRHKKYFWHASHLSSENLKKGAAKRNATADHDENRNQKSKPETTAGCKPRVPAPVTYLIACLSTLR